MVNTILAVLTWPSLAAILLLPKSPAFPRWIWVAWFLTLTAVSLLFLARGILLPSSVLRITNEENFIRRHKVELNLIFAIISALTGMITVIVWFFQK